MFMEHKSVVPTQKLKVDGCRPHVSALNTKLLVLCIISVCNVRHVFLRSSISACSARCSSPGDAKVDLMLSKSLVSKSRSCIGVCFGECRLSFSNKGFKTLFVTLYNLVALSFQVSSFNSESILFFPSMNCPINCVLTSPEH